jgi:uncharacterized protein
MNLVILDTIFSVVKLPPKEEIPPWTDKGEFISIVRTNEELSIVCPTSNVSNSLLKDV